MAVGEREGARGEDKEMALVSEIGQPKELCARG